MWFLKIFLLLITQYEKVKLDVVSDIINRKYEIRLEHGESKDDTSVKKKKDVCKVIEEQCLESLISPCLES